MLFFEITNRRANFLKKQFHNWSKFVAVQTNSLPGTVVLAQLVERLLPIPEVRGSNPVIGKNLFVMNIFLL